MKKLFSIVLGSVAFLVTSAYTIQAIINWQIDNEKSQVKFVMQAHGQELIGSFTGVKGDVKFDAADLDNSSFNCSIDVSTINTGNDKRNGHLKGATWFDSAAYPVITYVSKKISPAAGGYVAEGTLTAKGVSKDVTIPFTFSGDNTAGAFKGSFTIKRSEYGIGKVDAEVGDDVTIKLDIPVNKAN
ncbi:MAG: YceI family protein [Ferruginibacter sp.]